MKLSGHQLCHQSPCGLTGSSFQLTTAELEAELWKEVAPQCFLYNLCALVCNFPFSLLSWKAKMRREGSNNTAANIFLKKMARFALRSTGFLGKQHSGNHMEIYTIYIFCKQQLWMSAVAESLLNYQCLKYLVMALLQCHKDRLSGKLGV